ncbi:MAG TPA: cupredoxin domain-containing protein [Gaiellaceae bacterium]|nr:cupredoxin domain-containing protein [Gaiellaceae bacterium]
MPALRLGPSPPRKRVTVRVRVKGGYQPSVVHARVGEPLRIVFSREETASCSEHVVFPAFGMSAMLPPFEDVALDLVPERAGEYEFTCQMGMLRGRLVVVEDGNAAPRSSDRVSGSGTGPPRTSTAEERRDTVLLAFVGWACSVPLLLLVSVPFLGWKAGAALVLVWFAIAALACFFLCYGRVVRKAPIVIGDRDRVRSA